MDIGEEKDLSYRSGGGAGDQFLTKNEAFVRSMVAGTLHERGDIAKLDGKSGKGVGERTGRKKERKKERSRSIFIIFIYWFLSSLMLPLPAGFFFPGSSSFSALYPFPHIHTHTLSLSLSLFSRRSLTPSLSFSLFSLLSSFLSRYLSFFFFSIVIVGKRVVFSDGTVEDDIDTILLCTGYVDRFPFLKGAQVESVRKLYKHAFHPDLGPT